MGRSSVASRQALDAADAGVERILDEWDAVQYGMIAPGLETSIGRVVLPSNSGWYRGSVRRLNRRLYLIRAEGFNSDSTARREVGLLAQIETLDLGVHAALTTVEATTLGTAGVSGHDVAPGGWLGCPPLLPSIPALRTAALDTARLQMPLCPGLTCLRGSPPFVVDSLSSTPITVGDARWRELVVLATKTVGGGTYAGIGPVETGGKCIETAPLNWGNPAARGECGRYFPIVLVSGDVILRGGNGQGVLLVDGNLAVEGGFRFVGVVLVRGGASTSGTGGLFVGGVVARTANFRHHTVASTPVVQYSSCAVRRAQLSAPKGGIRLSRGWFHVY